MLYLQIVKTEKYSLSYHGILGINDLPLNLNVHSFIYDADTLLAAHKYLNYL